MCLPGGGRRAVNPGGICGSTTVRALNLARHPHYVFTDGVTPSAVPPSVTNSEKYRLSFLQPQGSQVKSFHHLNQFSTLNRSNIQL